MIKNIFPIFFFFSFISQLLSKERNRNEKRHNSKKKEGKKLKKESTKTQQLGTQKSIQFNFKKHKHENTHETII